MIAGAASRFRVPPVEKVPALDQCAVRIAAASEHSVALGLVAFGRKHRWTRPRSFGA